MTTLDSRVTALKTPHSPTPLAALVLRIKGDPSRGERAAVRQAEGEGRPVALVRCVDASVPEPDTSGAMQ